MQRLWIALGSVAGLVAVALSAIAAHGLEPIGPPRMQMLRSALQMQFWHALALLVCGLWAPRGGWLAEAAGAAFALGLLLFCGTLYALALAGVGPTMLAPVGGALLMLGWLLLGLSAARQTGRATRGFTG